MQRLQDAVRWAAELHYGQDRDGECPLPYLAHPIEVTSLLRYVGQVDDEDMLCAAVLHDVIEESAITRQDIEKRFGERVARLVQALTRQEPTPEQTNGLDKDQIWELRSGMLLEDIRAMDPEAWPIKLADRLSNLREAHYCKSEKKLDRYRRQTLAILEIIPKAANRRLWQSVLSETTAKTR